MQNQMDILNSQLYIKPCYKLSRPQILNMNLNAHEVRHRKLSHCVDDGINQAWYSVFLGRQTGFKIILFLLPFSSETDAAKELTSQITSKTS